MTFFASSVHSIFAFMTHNRMAFSGLVAMRWSSSKLDLISGGASGMKFEVKKCRKMGLGKPHPSRIVMVSASKRCFCSGSGRISLPRT